MISICFLNQICLFKMIITKKSSLRFFQGGIEKIEKQDQICNKKHLHSEKSQHNKYPVFVKLQTKKTNFLNFLKKAFLICAVRKMKPNLIGWSLLVLGFFW